MGARSPAEFFIKFLLSKQEHDLNAIIRMLEDYGIDSANASYLRRLQGQLDPRPDPWDLTSVEVKTYLRKHGIHDLWFPNAAVQEAFSILSGAALRTHVEQLALSPLRVEEMVIRLNNHYATKLTAEGLQAYGHYFWNKGLMTTQEWIEYLESRPMAAENISIMRVSPEMAQTLVPWATGMGGVPNNLNTGTVSRRMRDVAFLKVLETEHQPATLAHSKMMKNYMDVIKIAEDQMRQSDVALKDVLSAFEQFRLRKDEGNIPSIEAVAGPHYSKSGQGTDLAKNPLEEFDQEVGEDG